MKKIYEMSESNLLLLCQIFHPNSKWESQKRFYYDQENKRKFYAVDVYSQDKKIVWEYEGPNHYNDVWKVKRDNERKEYFEREGFSFRRWPYYCQLTKDIAKHFFNNDFTEGKYLNALKAIYKCSKEQQILAPGFHITKNTPANYVDSGSKKFLIELEHFPKSLKIQVIHSLKLYIKGIGEPDLIVPDTPDYQSLLSKTCSTSYLNYYYKRKINGSMKEDP